LLQDNKITKHLVKLLGNIYSGTNIHTGMGNKFTYILMLSKVRVSEFM
jgi:hypothetical protein